MDDDLVNRLDDFCLIGVEGSYCIIEYALPSIHILEHNDENAYTIKILLENKNPIFNSLEDFRLNSEKVLRKWKENLD